MSEHRTKSCIHMDDDGGRGIIDFDDSRVLSLRLMREAVHYKSGESSLKMMFGTAPYKFE